MQLKSEILKTLSFYDIFGFSLTPLEIRRGLGIKAEFKDILESLEDLCASGNVSKRNGYFFLFGSTPKREERSARFLISFKKLERARLAARFFSFFPFIRFIGVCNSLGFFNAKKESDIDFFIIAKAGHLWMARFFTVGFLRIFNMRPTQKTTQDKLCLSFFISDQSLDIKKIALDGGDPYLNNWLSWIIPLYDNGVYLTFLKENNWIKKEFPNFLGHSFMESKFSFLKNSLEKVFGFSFLESLFSYFQIKIMPKKIREAALDSNNNVIISDKMLKFHLLDRREEYRDIFYQKIKSINYNVNE